MDSAVDTSFSLLLRRFRRSAGLTQEELAHASGVSVRAVRDMERGRTGHPRPRTVRLLAEAMVLSADAHGQLLSAISENPEAPGAPAPPGSPAPPAPSSLPAVARHFAGRQAELAALDEMLDQVGEGQDAATTTTIHGTAGVGKTTLAVYWANRVAARFPDGQLYIDLQGFSPADAPVRPADALRGFLDALMVPAQARPDRVEDQAALYRSLLAERSMLVVLDNASHTDQVRPLLPGSPSCVTIVTCRRELAGLAVTHGARQLSLDVLSVHDASELLSRRLGPDRLTAEPAAARDLIDLCARLPLALSIAAARVAARPGTRLAAVAAELRGGPQRLDALWAGDAASDMRAVLSWSYQSLDQQTARMLRVLVVHPGPDVSAAALASMAAVPPRQARALAEELVRAGLLREDTPGRYALHDLLRAYATEQLRAAEGSGEAAGYLAICHRMLDHYLHTAYAAAALLEPAALRFRLAEPQPGVIPEPAADPDQALAWLAAEHRVLLALAALSAEQGFDTHAWQLPCVAAGFLGLRGHWAQWAATSRTALAAAQRLGDLAGQAHASRSAGCACLHLGEYDEASRHLRQAIELFGRLGDKGAVSRSLLNLAHTFEKQGQYREASRDADQALELAQAVGDVRGQAAALNAVSWCRLQLGEYDASMTHAQRALDLYRGVGDRSGEAATLDSLGYTHHLRGEYSEAIACCDLAAQLSRRLGYRYAEYEALMHLGDARQATGDTTAARASWLQALTILDELRHPSADDLRARLRPLV
ncbi:MAG TPA: tetratricopeptide repeat protein [Streptosporangiaceae bacterium]